MRWLFPLLALGAGCRNWPAYTGAFDLPTALGVLQPENGGPYEEPVGFVGNGHGGQIVPLALKQGRFLTDDATVAFLRTNQAATGQRRLLSGVYPFADGEDVTLFATDRAFEQIVMVPFVRGTDANGAPAEPASTIDEATFIPAAGSSASGTLTDVEIKTGWVSSEDWVVEFVDAERGWTVVGSRSGRLETHAQTGTPYVGVRRVVAFTISVNGEPAPGDRFEFRTDNGLEEFDAGGIPLELRVAPDGARAAVVVHSGDSTQLKWLDPADPAAFAASPDLLPDFAHPGRLAWSADGSRLFASDTVNTRVWEVDVASGTAVSHEMPWPTMDVAHLDGDEGDLIYTVPTDAKAVWIYDIDTGAFRDSNAWVPGVQGMEFSTPVNGVEALHIPYLQLAENDLGARYFRRAVATSLSAGQVVFADEGTGCLVTDGSGPRTEISGTFGTVQDYVRSFERDFPLGATLRVNSENSRHVLANPCGGVTKAQGWTLEYDEIAHGWHVRGDLSGPQATMAYEDERYVSDDGQITFTLLSGGTPSQDGWVITFRMIEGVTAATNDDGNPQTGSVQIDHPGDPLYFHYTVGGDDNGWRPQDDRPHVLVAGEASDRVGRVMPQEGLFDANWQ